jgi:hypothetical protein
VPYSRRLVQGNGDQGADLTEKKVGVLRVFSYRDYWDSYGNVWYAVTARGVRRATLLQELHFNEGK